MSNASRPPASRRTVRVPTGPAPGTDRAGAIDVDALELQGALADAITGEVRFDAGALGLYASDASNFRQILRDSLGAVAVLRSWAADVRQHA